MRYSGALCHVGCHRDPCSFTTCSPGGPRLRLLRQQVAMGRQKDDHSSRANYDGHGSRIALPQASRPIGHFLSGPSDRAEGSAEPIALVGLWHLGSVAAAAWASTGRSVIAWDPDRNLRRGLQTGHGPVAEPNLDAALTHGIERGLLRIADEPPFASASIAPPDLRHRSRIDGRSRRRTAGPGGRRVRRNRAAGLAAPRQLTTAGGHESSLARQTCTAEDRGLRLAHVPENLRLGRALDDFLHPDRLLIGSDDDAAFELAAAALAPFSSTPMRLSLASAEMAKHATNAYLALCVAFANDLAWLSLCAGADPSEVAAALRADPRVSPSAPLQPGPAFSGATLMRDLVTLRNLGEKCGRPDLFDTVIRSTSAMQRLYSRGSRSRSARWRGRESPSPD